MAAFLVLALVGGSIAIVQRGRAQRAATVALSQSLGAKAIVEPRTDTAMLLGVEATNLDPSTTTQGDLLSTLLREPSVVRTFHNTDSRLNGLALSPDGRQLVMVDNDGHLTLADTATGRTISSYTIGDSTVSFMPDGSLARLEFGPDNGVRAVLITDPVTGRIRQRLPVPKALAIGHAPLGSQSLSISADGHRLAIEVQKTQLDSVGAPEGTGPSYLLQWELPSGQMIGPPRLLPGALGASYLPSGRALLVSGGKVNETVDAATGKTLRTYPIPGLATLSPDGHTAAFIDAGGTVTFLDLHTGRVVQGVGTYPELGAMTFSPDGTQLVTAQDSGAISIWNISSGLVVRTLTDPSGYIRAIAISSDGHSMYTGSFDSTTLEWDLSGSRGFAQRIRAAHSLGGFGAWNVAMSPDEHTIAVGDTDGVVHLWDTRTAREVEHFQAIPGVVTALAFENHGRSLLVAGMNEAAFGDPANGQAYLRVWSVGATPRLEHVLRGMDSFIDWAAVSPDGSTAVASGWASPKDADAAAKSAGAADEPGQVEEWDLGTGSPLATPMTLPDLPDDVAFAPHGTTVATASEAGWAYVADPARGTILRRFRASERWAFGVAFSPDGTKVATGDLAGSLRVWDARSGAPLSPPVTASEVKVTAVSWSPDGTKILTVGSDGTARLFDAETLAQIGGSIPLPQEPNNMYATFSPDGSQAIITDASGRVWIFPTSLASWRTKACAVANSNLSTAAWARSLPGRPYQKVCSDDP